MPLRSLLASFLVLVLGLPSACRSVRSTPPPELSPAPPSVPASLASIPPWLAEPLSWAKLRQIETWLVTEGSRAATEWRVEGELVLNQGRLELTRREAALNTGEKQSPSAITARLRAAKAGLARVVSDPAASPAQKKRAGDSLARADKLLAARGSSATRSPLGNAVIARSSWGAAPPITAKMDRTKGSYTRITIHHSADPDPTPLDGTLATTARAVREIQHAHMDGRETHYGDIGYHLVIDPEGRVLEGRSLEFQGAHAYGDNNIQNIGVCLIGNFETDKPTQKALDSLRQTIDQLRAAYKIPKASVWGHRDLRKTECPGDNLQRWITAYKR